MKKFWSALLIICLVLTLFTSVHAAESESKVTERKIVGKMIGKKFENSKCLFSTTLKPGESKEFFMKVDKKTCQAELYDPSEVKRQSGETISDEGILRGTKGPQSPSNSKNSESGDVSIDATLPYENFYAWIHSEVIDPVNITVNELKSTLYWSGNATDVTNISGTYWTDQFDTSGWYLVSSSGFHYDNGDHAKLETKADFENYDWGDNTQGTWSYHEHHIWGNADGTAEYWWIIDDWGEDSDLLWQYVAVDSGTR
jgi:hypothetical protein